MLRSWRWQSPENAARASDVKNVFRARSSLNEGYSQSSDMATVIQLSLRSRINMNRLRLMPLLPALLIAGCAGSPFAESLRFDRLQSFNGPDAGYAFASIAKSKDASLFSSVEMLIRPKNSDDLSSFGYQPKAYLTSEGASKTTVKSEVIEGTVVVRKLPPGDYEVFEARGVSNIGGTFIYKLTFNQPMTFTVNPGKPTYVGRFVVGQGGSFRSRHATLAIGSELEADFEVAKDRLPGVTSEDVQRSTSLRSP